VIIDFIGWLNRRWLRLILLTAVAIWMVILAWPGEEELMVVFCDVGQGDSILIQRGFSQILIDGGKTDRVLGCLERYMSFFDRTIDAVVVSHAKTDHFGGLIGVVENYNVMSFVYNGRRGDAEAWKELSSRVELEQAEVIGVKTGDRVVFDGVDIRVLWPRGVVGAGLDDPDGGESQFEGGVLGVHSSGDLNAGSIVLWLSYDEFDALLTGDIGQDQEQEIVDLVSSLSLDEDGSDDQVEVLKVAHHGSRFSSSDEFLQAVQPDLAVIQVGRNSYGHPTSEVLDRLGDVGARILRTDQDGDVVVSTDGVTWRVTTSD
jgi:competence protein ComEC